MPLKHPRIIVLSCGFGSSTPLDSTIYYGAEPTIALSTAQIYRQIYIPKGGTIKRCTLSTYAASATGTNEDIVIAIRINNTTDYTFATVGAATVRRNFINNNLNIKVNSGDFLEFKITTPAWATNPEGFRGFGYLVLECP